MDAMELIKTRKSVRTFDGRRLDEGDVAKLRAYCPTIENPYGIPVEFLFLDADDLGLSSPVIKGEHLYIAGKVPLGEHAEEAFGFSFEKLVLFAWSLGVGTTWIGGTFRREMFEQAAGATEDVAMMIVTPVGYPADYRSEVDAKLRAGIHGDERLAASELFFEGDFTQPLSGDTGLLEAVRWAPSAVNLQPWRVVRDGSRYHFFEKHTMGPRSDVRWDVQAIDMGIALCHLMEVAGGTFSIADPGIARDEDTDYIATIAI